MYSMVGDGDIEVHGRTGRLESVAARKLAAVAVHGRTGRLETTARQNLCAGMVHGRTGRLEKARTEAMEQ